MTVIIYLFNVIQVMTVRRLTVLVNQAVVIEVSSILLKLLNIIQVMTVWRLTALVNQTV